MADEMDDPKNRYDEREAGRQFADPQYAERQRLARSFEDPNALDDARLGKSFEETNSSGKRRKSSGVRDQPPTDRRKIAIFLIAFLALFLIVVIAGWLPRYARTKEINRRAEEQQNSKPVVDAAKVEPSQSQQGLVLPGTTIPLTEAYVYARASGYLKMRLVDIGDHVHKDQLLAVVDAPDLDQQVAQAKQQLMQAERQLDQQKSQLALATVTVQRYRVLVAKGVFSKQDGDQQETNYASQVANVQAAQRNVDAYQANLGRVEALQGYEAIRAPFAGVITQRNVDVGALIASSGVTSGAESAPAPEGQTSTSGGSQQAGQVNTGGSSGATSTAATPTQSPGQGGPLFGLAQTQRLRILVSVPEGFLTAIHTGGRAQLTFQEYPGVNFAGEITRTANSVDPNTRTMLTEVQVDNRNGKLFPGMYALVTFPPTRGAEGPLLVRGDAVVIRQDRPTIATVVDGKVHLRPVTIGRDFGDVVEILTGLRAGDIIVTNVTDDVVEGAEVEPHFTKTSDHESEGQQQNPAAQNPGKQSQGESKS